MDLVFNAAAPFTRWIVSTGALRENFVVVDVGVQGGEHPRWHLLGDHLVVHGFDPIAEVIEALRRQNAEKPNRHYHCLAAGSSDTEAPLYFDAADPCSSSLYTQGDDRFRRDGSRIEQSRPVRVRRLDGLLADGTIPHADFLKLDVEGFEQEVLAGAGALLSAAIGVETETNFGISPTQPRSHFVAIHELLLPHRLLTFDLAFDRVPRASFRAAVERTRPGWVDDGESIGKPATVSALFCRDVIAEADQPQNYLSPSTAAPSVDMLIKAMAIYELHGLSDVALDMAVRFGDQLGSRFDVAEAVALLADPDCRPPSWRALHARAADAERRLAQSEHERQQIEASTSWRMTAPLRALGHLHQDRARFSFRRRSRRS